MTIRTSVASMNTATASVNPSIFTTRKFPKVNAAKTTIMIAAALVMRPAVLASPSGIASISLIPDRLAFENAGDQKDFVVHAEAEDDREGNDRLTIGNTLPVPSGTPSQLLPGRHILKH